MDEQLNKSIDLCRQGDADAFRYIVDRYQKMVYTLAFRLLCNEEDAEDLTQETFVKVWLHIGRYKPLYRFSTWVYKIACNAAYDKLRSEPTVRKVELDHCRLAAEDDPARQLHNQHVRSLLLKATETLSPKQKLVFVLSEIEELDTHELVAITGMSSAKIKSNLYLARKCIKNKLSGYDE